MSQYYGNTRTNYFKVTDADKFREFIKEVKDQELDPVILWEKEDESGVTFFAFGCYSSIEGILTSESRVKKIIYEACAEAYSIGHLTEDVLSVIFEDLELNGLEYDKNAATDYFNELIANNDFPDKSDCDECEDDEYCEEDVEYTFDGFIEELQKFLPDGEAVVIMEAGHEKLVYVGGSVTVITNNDCKYVPLEEVAEHLAKQMTQNENIKITYC